MRIATARRLALAVLLTASCDNPPKAPPPEAAAEDLKVAWRIDTDRTVPREGGLIPLEFRITNTTPDVVVLRTLRYLARTGEDSAPAATWQFARGGRLDYRAERDEWEYDRRRRGRRAPVFNSGLIVPKETVVVRSLVRLLHLPKSYHLLYFRLTSGELRRKVYWENREDGFVRYTTLLGDDLRDRLWARTEKNKAGHRVVVFPHAEIVDTARGGARIRLIRVNPEVRPRAFSLDHAIARAGGGPPEAFTYSEAFGGWILDRRGGPVLVTARGVKRLARIRRLEPFFFFVDRVGVEKVEIELRDETKSVFAEDYSLVADPEKGRVYLFLQPLDLLPFLEDAYRFKLSTDVEFTPQGGARIVVTNR